VGALGRRVRGSVSRDEYDVPVPADTGDASSPGSGLVPSTDDGLSLFDCFWVRFRLCQSRQKVKPTTATIPSEPPIAPPITAFEGLELPLEEVEFVGCSGLDVGRGAVDERRMFRSLKYSN